MRIAYASLYNAKDINAWSGTAYYMGECLKGQYSSLHYIGPLKSRWYPLFKRLSIIYRLLFNTTYIPEWEHIIWEDYAKLVKRLLSQVNVDVLFSAGIEAVAYLDYRRPIVFWTDQTFAEQCGTSHRLYNTRFCRRTIRDGNAAERAAIGRCRFAIYSSHWAAQSAIDDYKANPLNVEVIPFGANIECSRSIEDIRKIIEKRDRDKCRLLFVGKAWLRKGGDIAIRIAQKLNDMGLPTELTVVGVGSSMIGSVPAHTKVVGVLDKSKIEDRSLLDKLYTQSHFFIMPSRAEPYGIVLAEANSFGVPCIASKSGGIPTIIKDGLNGMTFASGSPIEGYCTYIYNLFSDYSKYSALAEYAFNEYQTRLNWRVAGEKLSRLLANL